MKGFFNEENGKIFCGIMLIMVLFDKIWSAHPHNAPTITGMVIDFLATLIYSSIPVVAIFYFFKKRRARWKNFFIFLKKIYATFFCGLGLSGPVKRWISAAASQPHPKTWEPRRINSGSEKFNTVSIDIIGTVFYFIKNLQETITK